MAWLLAGAALAWVVYAVFGRRWRVEPLLERVAPGSYGRVVAVVPARNEAQELPATLPCLFRQTYEDFSIVLVDDHSTDDTAAIAARLALEYGAKARLQIVQPPPLPPGWMGKVWAQKAGCTEAARLGAEWIWFTDADIRHEPDVLERLLSTATRHGRDFVSVMARLRTDTWAEKLLIPAFTYFFAMLYPFHRIADDTKSDSGAAGGCMLVRRELLERAGGLDAIRDAVIDDVALASAAKRVGGRLWLGYHPGVQSTRGYGSLRAVTDMVARSAYTQLHYNPLLLVVCVVGLFFVFLWPFMALWLAPFPAKWWAALAYAAMVRTYLPLVHFLGCGATWALALPMAAALYLWMTVLSAWRFYRGTRTRWKGREYKAS
ncbi:MAG: glycosyl transferase family 2 [Candidatus Binatia bacterium]|nr:MAG: glycosyl transferase family 2 [Candidatus Binatia bacterium]